MDEIELMEYQDLIDKNPAITSILNEDSWDFIEGCSDFTCKSMEKQWAHNIKSNIKYYKMFGSIKKLEGFGIDKAFIGVGAGPSFNINKRVLKTVFDFNLRQNVKDQPFLIVSTNHQFKSLLKAKVVPHFVVLLDSGYQLYDQLDTKEDSILIASLFADPKIIKDWVKKKRKVYFFLPESSEEIHKVFEDMSGVSSKEVSIHSGGNIMNAMWLMSLQVFGSRVFMALGCDYSYDFSYGDGGNFYSDNDLKVDSRNQLDTKLAWQGFYFDKCVSSIGKPVISLKTMNTSKQMWMYKQWIELHVMLHQNQNFKFINCSEKGILGVLTKSWKLEDFYKKDNWYLMDEVCKNWMTMKFENAVEMYLEALSWLEETQTGILTGAGNVVHLPGKINGVNGAVLM